MDSFRCIDLEVDDGGFALEGAVTHHSKMGIMVGFDEPATAGILKTSGSWCFCDSQCIGQSAARATAFLAGGLEKADAIIAQICDDSAPTVEG